MTLIVQKFGGSSLSDMDRMAHVARIIIDTQERGHQVVVVVSAMYGETNRLIQLAHSISCKESPREYAVLLASGEQASAALLSMMLQKLGVQANSYTGAQARILTTGDHKKAHIIEIDPTVLQAALLDGLTPVVAGFQGVNHLSEITTLGRGGSDITAVALAAALQAKECQIFTDVDGVYSCDPKIVSKSIHIPEITFDEMMEMSSLGANVLQSRCLKIAGKYQVPVRVLSSFSPKSTQGTLISFNRKQIESPTISGIVLDRHQAKLTLQGIPERPGLASYILSPMSEANIDIDMIVQNVPTHNGRIDFSFTLHRDDYPIAYDRIKTVSHELGVSKVIGSQTVAKLSLIGVGMRSHANIASRMFSALGKEGIPIHLITATEIKLSALIDEGYIDLGARILHDTFYNYGYFL